MLFSQWMALSFCYKVIISWIPFDDCMQDICAASVALTQHLSVFHSLPKRLGGLVYTWHNPLYCLFGESTHAQCPLCKRVYPLEVSYVGGSGLETPKPRKFEAQHIILQCKGVGCTWCEDREPSKDVTKVKGSKLKGSWITYSLASNE
jgi:hypothetical protein